MQWDWMQCDPCSMQKWNLIECSGFYAAWPNASWLNAVDFRQHVPKHPDWMQCIPCSMIEWSGFLQHEWMQWIFCSMTQSIPIECSGVYAAWRKASRLMAVDIHALWLNKVLSMQRGEMHPDWTQCIQCIVAKWIPIQCSGFYAAWPNWSQLNAVDSMHHGAMDPNWMQWNRCSVIECSVFHAAW